MMNVLFAGMIALSLLFGILNGQLSAVSEAALNESVGAVELCLKLCGGMCLWSGLMKVAQRSGLTDRIAKWMSPILRPLFHDVPPGSRAFELISMNVTASLLGLGNAVTPLGIAAMRELEGYNPRAARASDSMVMFVVLNTASLQLIPTTTAMLRLAAGSAAPMEILPAVWVASLCSVLSGVLMVTALKSFFC